MAPADNQEQPQRRVTLSSREANGAHVVAVAGYLDGHTCPEFQSYLEDVIGIVSGEREVIKSNLLRPVA